MGRASRILPVSDPASFERAARVLRKGGLVAFPTETVYGLGASALDAKAVLKIFRLKKRPSFDPLIVHASSSVMARKLWRRPPARALALAAAYWPGPLTLVLPRSPIVPDVVTSGLDTVAVRVPSHPAARALIERFGAPIAAPSANLFGRTSATTAQMVLEDLGGGVDLVLDGGPATLGVESTVLKYEGGRFHLLRPGGVTLESLRRRVRVVTGSPERRIESPGQLASHYAPRTPLALAERGAAAWIGERRRRGALPRKVGVLAFRARPRTPGVRACEVLSRAGSLSEAAFRLFQAMRKLDKMRLDLIVAEAVPSRGLGLAVNDRLRRASAPTHKSTRNLR